MSKEKTPLVTEHERIRIQTIKRDFFTRNRWSKQDYSDFYYRDVLMLIGILDRMILNPPEIGSMVRELILRETIEMSSSELRKAFKSISDEIEMLAIGLLP